MLTDRFCVIHIPRMGGSAFARLCAAHVETVVGMTGHLTGPDLAWICVPKVALLRDPWSWYRSVASAWPFVAERIEATYAATVQRYLVYPDGTSPAVDAVYPWPWRQAVTALLREAHYTVAAWEPLDAWRAVRATPPERRGPGAVPTAADVALWEAYGGQV